MAFIVFFLLIVSLGAVGFWRGAIRIGLAIAPLMLASVFLWMSFGLIIHSEMFQRMGVITAMLIPVILGLGLGYTLQFTMRKRIPKANELHIADRASGAVVGVIISTVVMWLGTVYVTVKAATEHRQVSHLTSSMSNMLNKGVVQWIPGIGAGSDRLMSLVDIATADEAYRAEAVENLDIAHLGDDAAVMAVIEDPEIQASLERLAAGNFMEIFRLQNNQKILDMFESEAVREVLDRVSIDDVAVAVKDAQETAEGDVSGPDQESDVDSDDR